MNQKQKKIILEFTPKEIKLLAYGVIPQDLKIKLRDIAYYLDDEEKRTKVIAKDKVSKGRKLTRSSLQDKKLFEKLRKLRKEISQEEKLPAFAIFHNKDLAAMIKYRPSNKEEMVKIPGIGQKKFQKYGYRFLYLIGKNGDN